jgi:endogenous inhibitor of DNA gyrase (YacG/DUF329 family)
VIAPVLDALGVDTTNPNYKAAGSRTCEACGVVFLNYQKARRFCSKACYDKSKIVRLTVPCKVCGKEFRQHVETSKYCSRDCVRKDKPRVKGYVPRPLPKNIKPCGHCGVEFHSPRSSNRKFCSYACHLASGGAKRAGEASARAMLKYGAKKDANHKEIFDFLYAQTAVRDLSTMGFGVPDGIAWVHGGWQFFDVKNPRTGYGKRGLNQRQMKWADDWRGGPVYLIYSIEDAQKFLDGEFQSLKHFPEEHPGAKSPVSMIPFKGVVR